MRAPISAVVLLGLLGASTELWAQDISTFVWEERTVVAPSSRNASGCLVYDSLRDRLVLYGGLKPSSPVNDLWEWDSIAWQRLAPTTSPVPLRQDYAMVFDPVRGHSLLFGGYRSGQYYADLWSWDGTDWASVPASIPPPGRAYAQLAFDRNQGKVVVFGGSQGSTMLGDTWTFDGTDWVEIVDPSGPAPRRGAGMAYDEQSNTVVLFGGWDGTGELADTWTFDGIQWTERSPSVIPYVWPWTTAIYDGARQRVVLTGSAMSAAVWEWDGTDWTEIPVSTGPYTSNWMGAAYHEVRQRAVYFGGHNDGFSNAMWDWDGASFHDQTPATAPSFRIQHRMAFDAARGATVLFGGSLNADDQRFGDTWKYDGINWVQQHPATTPLPRYQHSMAFDSTRAVTVLFGGYDQAIFDTNGWLEGLQFFDDTWEYDGVNWSQISPNTVPQARKGQAMAFDSVRNRIVMYGGENDQGALLNEIWEYDGTDWTLTTADASWPAVRGDTELAFDEARGVTVMFGGWLGGVLDDTWTWDGSQWYPMTPSTIPSARAWHTLTYDSVAQRVVMVGGQQGTGSLNSDHTWAWDGVDWIALNQTPTLPAINQHAAAYDSIRERLVVFAGIDEKGFQANTWEFGDIDHTGNAPPTLSPIADATVSVGSLLSITVSASDPDNDPLAYYTIDRPTGATFDPLGRQLTWTPQTQDVGQHDVAFVVTDGLQPDWQVVTINVLPIQTDGGIPDAAIPDATHDGSAPDDAAEHPDSTTGSDAQSTDADSDITDAATTAGQHDAGSTDSGCGCTVARSAPVGWLWLALFPLLWRTRAKRSQA